MVSVSTYILNIRSDGECKVIYYCTTERGVRGRTGVFDGLTLQNRRSLKINGNVSKIEKKVSPGIREQPYRE